MTLILFKAYKPLFQTLTQKIQTKFHLQILSSFIFHMLNYKFEHQMSNSNNK